MGKRVVKLNCQISFDDKSEMDIVEVIDKLNRSRLTGKFISNVIKTVLQSPESLSENVGLSSMEIAKKYCNECKVSYDRKKFVRDVTTKVEKLKAVVDELYNKSMMDYTIAAVTDSEDYANLAKEKIKIAIELERCLDSMRDTLGLSISNPVYESSKLSISERKAEEYAKFIQNNIDVIRSLSGFTVENKEKPKTVENKVKDLDIDKADTIDIDKIDNVNTWGTDTGRKKEPRNDTPEVETDTSEVIIDFGNLSTESTDFGGDDLGLLEDFFSAEQY